MFEWKIKEYENSEKTWDWYVTVPTIFIALVIVAIFLDNILFAIFVAMAGVTLILYAHRPPRDVSVKIDKRGIVLNNNFHPMSSLSSFWIEPYEEGGVLLVRSKSTFVSLISIPIPEEIDSDNIDDFLIEFLEEEELDEPLSQKIMEYLGF